MSGITAGGTMVTDQRGGYVGGETSIVRLADGGRYGGAFLSGYRDFGAGLTYLTGGGELGYQIFGVDAGPLVRLGAGRAEAGVAGRLSVTFGVLSLYGRYGYLFDPVRDDDNHVVQVGASLKLPIKTWGYR